MSNWTPGTLLKLSGSYWQACTLHAAVKLDLITQMGSEPIQGSVLAKTLSLDSQGLVTLLNALAAMDLVDKTGHSYAATPAAQNFLSKDSESYIGYMILHHHHLAESWVNMDQAVSQGRPIRHAALSQDPEVRESFLMGMFNIAMATAPDIAQILDLSHCTRLLDLGGGPGTYAIHFCLAHPGLKAVVFDQPTTRPFAEKTIARFNLQGQVSFVPGDYTRGPLTLGQTFDAAWLSHILHGQGPDMAEQVIEKALKAVHPGGSIFIHEFILDDTCDSPLFPALFSMNMFLATQKGQSYSQEDLFGMLERQGVRDICRLDFSGPTQSGIIWGKKKK
jgi:SAM-dependent methyltransferase